MPKLRNDNALDIAIFGAIRKLTGMHGDPVFNEDLVKWMETFETQYAKGKEGNNGQIYNLAMHEIMKIASDKRQEDVDKGSYWWNIFAPRYQEEHLAGTRANAELMQAIYSFIVSNLPFLYNDDSLNKKNQNNDTSKINLNKEPEGIVPDAPNMQDIPDIPPNTTTPNITNTPNTTNVSNTTSVLIPGTNSNSYVWSLDERKRGQLIEENLANTEYSEANGYYNIGQDRGGYFPVIDFQKGNEVISLKSIDPRLPSYQNDGATNKIIEYIDMLNPNAYEQIEVNGIPATKILDIRIPPGTKGLLDMKEIIDAANAYPNTYIQIKEY